MKIHDLTAALLAMPAINEASEAVRLSLFILSLQDDPRFKKVTHRGLSYTVGHWGGWEGNYWLVEDSTGIIFRVGSVRELRDLIKLCSAVHHEPDAIRH